MNTTLKQLLDERRDEILEGIRANVNIDSVRGEATEDAPFGEGPKKALLHALELGESLGLRTKNVDNYAGWVEIGEGEEMVAALGHLDVVPIGEGWNYPPFGGVIEDGKMYGRGVADDKGPTIGAMYALKAIKDAGIKLDRRIRVIMGTDEECGSSCMEYYIKAGEEIPVMGFTPDAEYPLIFCEKGMAGMKIGKKNPAKGRVIAWEGGVASNVVTEKCMLKAEGDINLSFKAGVEAEMEEGIAVIRSVGKSAHGSTPALGENAAIKLLESVKGNDFGGDFQNMMNFLLNEIGTETNGEKLGIRYYDPETGETTVNVGVVTYTEEELSVTLDIRFPQNGDHGVIHDKMAALLSKYGLEILSFSPVDVLYVPKDSELVTKLMKVYKECTGRDDEPLAIGGGTYAKMFPNMVAFGAQFPEIEETIHQPNEYAVVENLLLSIQISAEALVALATK